MPIALDDLQQLIRDHERVCREEAELSGRLKEALKRLKTELGVASAEEAKALVNKLLKRRDKQAAKYHKAYKQFKVDFNKSLSQREGRS